MIIVIIVIVIIIIIIIVIIYVIIYVVYMIVELQPVTYDNMRIGEENGDNLGENTAGDYF